jgi:hypothetical protein
MGVRFPLGMSIFKAKVVPAIGLAIGVFFLAAHFFGDRFLDSIPSKSELVEISGETEWAELASKKGRDVRFKIKDKGTFVHSGFGSSLAIEIYEAISPNGTYVRILADITDNREPMFHDFSYNPVYEISANGKLVRSYEDAIASGSRAALIFPWFGLFMVIASIYEYRKNRRKY